MIRLTWTFADRDRAIPSSATGRRSTPETCPLAAPTWDTKERTDHWTVTICNIILLRRNRQNIAVKILYFHLINQNSIRIRMCNKLWHGFLWRFGSVYCDGEFQRLHLWHWIRPQKRRLRSHRRLQDRVYWCDIIYHINQTPLLY